ncbi:MAG: isoprenylcysteine carboxylmethyltransferase family protein [bacterium]
MILSLENLQRMTQTPGGMLELVSSLVISLSATVVFAAVFINFLSCRREGVKRERKSIVATGSMTSFFVLVYLVIRFRVGEVSIPWFPVRLCMVLSGLMVIVTGCIVNILGRFQLGGNWANQATIYQEQKLVMSGVYSWVRHPLYASLIWMFFGAGLVYANVVAFLLTALVFWPFMVYRAGLEEAMLAREFSEYADYQRNVGRFFWKTGLRRGGVEKGNAV